jgi:hypothetical protein
MAISSVLKKYQAGAVTLQWTPEQVTQSCVKTQSPAVEVETAE